MDGDVFENAVCEDGIYLKWRGESLVFKNMHIHSPEKFENPCLTVISGRLPDTSKSLTRIMQRANRDL